MTRPAHRDREPAPARMLPRHRLRRLELLVTRRLDGLLHGQYQGLFPGSGSEFCGAREYRPGEDEVRQMDWAITARTGVPHIRQLDADRELTTWLLVDATGSMDFGTAELEKRELAAAAVAAVGLLTTGVGNRIGAHLLGPNGIRRMPPRGGRSHLLGLLHTLLTAPRDIAATEPGALAGALHGLHAVAVRRGLIVVISDFLDGLPEVATDAAVGEPLWAAPLHRLAARHQVLAVEIVDPRELALPDVGLINLVDPETGRRRLVPTGDRRLRDRYAEAAAAQRRLIAQSLIRAGAAHLPLRTDRDWVADIARHVQQQRRLANAAAVPANRSTMISGGTR